VWHRHHSQCTSVQSFIPGEQRICHTNLWIESSIIKWNVYEVNNYRYHCFVFVIHQLIPLWLEGSFLLLCLLHWLLGLQETLCHTRFQSVMLFVFIGNCMSWFYGNLIHVHYDKQNCIWTSLIWAVEMKCKGDKCFATFLGTLMYLNVYCVERICTAVWLLQCICKNHAYVMYFTLTWLVEGTRSMLIEKHKFISFLVALDCRPLALFPIVNYRYTLSRETTI